MKYLLFSLLVACGASNNVGNSCTKDSECGELKCLHDKRSENNMCVDSTTPPTGTCSPACTAHKDCQKYGATLKCALSSLDVACNPTGLCLDNYTCTGSSCRIAPDAR